MTHRAAGSPRGIPRIWLLPAVLLTGILVVTATGILSRSLILDLVAWWPAWLLLTISVAVAGRRRIGKVRVDGMVPILVTLALVVFIVAHVNGWPLNPSASRYLIGPEPQSYTDARLTASVDGELVVRGGSEFLYEVNPLPEGGEIGVPAAEERTVEESISVELTAPTDAGFNRFSGWEIQLSSSPRWSLDLAGDLKANLTGLSINELDMSGAGRVSLGFVDEATQVTLEGAFSVAVPVGVPVRVVGSAQVPATWVQLSDGWRAPVEGVGWVISVPQGSVAFLEER